MTGYEYAKQFNTAEEKVCVLILDAIKAAYNMAGKTLIILRKVRRWLL